MKQATGEANITVITITLIGVIAALAAVFVPRLLDNVQKQAICNEASGKIIKGNICQYETKEDDGSTTIHQRTLQKCSDGSWDFPGECK